MLLCLDCLTSGFLRILFLDLLQARLIMMYAEKAGLSAQAGARMQKSQFAPPSSGASPQAARASLSGPSQRGLQPDSKPNKVCQCSFLIISEFVSSCNIKIHQSPLLD